MLTMLALDRRGSRYCGLIVLSAGQDSVVRLLVTSAST
jgi:hypothetical protein